MARVLVVDDEPDLRELLRVSLSLAGHEVILAADGLRGLESARAERPDLVILDVMMPGLDGWTVLSSIKADSDPRVATIPVLMLTARTEDLDIVKGGIEGAVRYLTKPFSIADLRQAVTDSIEGAPEPEQRRAAQYDALVRLARLEKGSAAPGSAQAHPRLSRLEPVSGARPSAGVPASGTAGSGRGPGPWPSPVRGSGPPGASGAPSGLGAVQRDESGTGSLLGAQAGAGRRDGWPSWLSSDRLSLRDREILQAVATTANLNEARSRLQVSRGYLYATLRRIAGKLDFPTGPALVRALRAASVARERRFG